MKVLKIAAAIVAVAAIVIPGVGQAIQGALGAVFSGTAIGGGVTAAGFAAASIATAALEIGGVLAALSLITPKPSGGGEQTKWKADPYAGIPYVMGRTLTSGNIVYRRGHGDNYKYNTFVTILSLGLIASIDTTFMEKTTVAFDGGGAATGTYHGYIWQASQLGALPEATALTPPVDSPPGWTSAHKLSGLAAVMNTFRYDAKSKNGLTNIPQPAWIVHGNKVYDPRLDSTYPGGSGTCRALEESTYVWSENPHLHALTWCLGRWQNGVRCAGIGAPVAAIDIAAFVDGANLDDARGWKIGGQVYTRPDTLWNSLKAMCQAGGAAPVMVGGKISCINRAPRVSLATIGRGDIVGKASLAATQPRRSRINTIIPQYRSEAHDWEMVSASAVAVADYITMDGDERTQEIAYPLVQDVNQVAQLAAYDICDLREAGPGTVPLKPWWLNYRVGDCVTFAPEDGWSLKTIVIGRAIDAQSATVTYTLRGETDAKHAFALGQEGAAPPVPDPQGTPDPKADPSATDWTLTAPTIDGVATLHIAGGTTDDSVASVILEYRIDDGSDPATATDWISSGDASNNTADVKRDVAPILPDTQYYAAVSYSFIPSGVSDRLILGPVTTSANALPEAVAVSATGSAGSADIVVRAPQIAGWTDMQLLRGTSTSYGAAAAVGSAFTGALYETLTRTDSGLAAGTYYWWIEVRDAGGAEISHAGPVSTTVT